MRLGAAIAWFSVLTTSVFAGAADKAPAAPKAVPHESYKNPRLLRQLGVDPKDVASKPGESRGVLKAEFQQFSDGKLVRPSQPLDVALDRLKRTPFVYPRSPASARLRAILVA